MKKVIALVLVLLMGLSAWAMAQEDNSVAAIQEKGTFVLGLDDSFPPMEMCIRDRGERARALSPFAPAGACRRNRDQKHGEAPQRRLGSFAEKDQALFS